MRCRYASEGPPDRFKGVADHVKSIEHTRVIYRTGRIDLGWYQLVNKFGASHLACDIRPSSDPTSQSRVLRGSQFSGEVVETRARSPLKKIS